MELGRKDVTNRFSASAYADIRFFKGLNYHIIGSYTYTGTDNDDNSGGRRRFNNIDGKMTEVAYTSDNRYNFSLGLNQYNVVAVEHYLTYKLDTEVHSLTAMFGNSMSMERGSWSNASGTDYYAPSIRYTSMAKDQTSRTGYGGFNPEVKKLSYYGRIVYGLYDLFNLTATIRRDGNSNFAKSKRWGTFPSVAAAWRIKDTFMQNVDAISNLKLRAGWGQTGNAGGVAGKSTYALSNSGVRYNFYTNNGLGKGSASSGFYAPLVDTNITWEPNEQINVGLDLGLLDGDLDITVDYFIRKTTDLLLWRSIRPSSGYKMVYTNYGDIENKGFEFTATYRKYLGNDWSLNATLTGSTIKNKVTDMPNSPIYRTAKGGNSTYASRSTVDDMMADNSNTYQVDGGALWDNHSISTVGYAVGSYWGWRVDRLIKTEEDLKEAKRRGQTKAKIGDYMFKDLDGKTDANGNLVCDDGDREVIGDGFPALNFGLNIGLTYKNWDFALFAYGELGKKILSYSAMRLSMITTSDDNTTAAILKSSYDQIYDPVTNPNGTLPAYSFVSENYNQRVSDAWLMNGNFLKISNVQIGYNLNDRALKALHMQNARIYFAVQNLATISPYTKYGDPECGQGSVLLTGLDTGRYPMARTYMLGFNVTF
jgi:TonB-linked SusC/RagA family outer membrane protein